MVYAMAVVKLLSWICVVITWKSRGVMASKSFFSGRFISYTLKNVSYKVKPFLKTINIF